MQNNTTVPVLFIIFNRPEITRRSLQEIRRARPARLYVAADGPRRERAGEEELCARTREIVLQGVDWPCEVKTLLRDENVGCGRGVSEAISWFFEHEEYGVILEDDCIPAAEFFPFMEEMLLRYKDDDRIAQVNGFVPECTGAQSDSYRFTGYPNICGWGTWRRSWKHIDFRMEEWPRIKKNVFRRFSFPEGLIHLLLWEKIYRRIASGRKAYAWGPQWSIRVFMENKLCVQPLANLINNIGMGEGTNCSDAGNKLGKTAHGKLTFPLKHPEKVELIPAMEKKRSRQYVFYYACYLPARKLRKWLRPD